MTHVVLPARPVPPPSLLIRTVCHRLALAADIIRLPSSGAATIIEQLHDVLDQPMEWMPDGQVGAPHTYTAGEVLAFMKKPAGIRAAEDLSRGHPAQHLVNKKLFPNSPATNELILAVIRVVEPWAEAIDPPNVKKDMQQRWWWRQCTYALDNTEVKTTVAVWGHFRERVLSANEAVCRQVVHQARERRKNGAGPDQIEAWLGALCDSGLVQPKTKKSILLRSAIDVGGVAQALVLRSTPRACNSQALCTALLRWDALGRGPRGPIGQGSQSVVSWANALRWEGERDDVQRAIDVLLPHSSIPDILHTARGDSGRLKRIMRALVGCAPQVAEQYLTDELIMSPGLADDPELARIVLQRHIGLKADDPKPPGRRRVV